VGNVMCIMGVDPGLTGAIAFYFPDHPERVSVEDMPVAGGRLDAVTLTRRIRQFSPDLAVVESVHAGKGWGNGVTFSFGEGCGVVRGVLGALEIPTHMVTPPSWKKHWRLLKAEKDDSRALALRLFPSVGSHFARKKDDGRAEAALIARYGAEVLSGLVADRSITRPVDEARA